MVLANAGQVTRGKGAGLEEGGGGVMIMGVAPD